MPATASTKISRSAKKTRPQPVSVSAEERRQMIEESAYFRAQERDFQGGDPIADWLLSEKEVDKLLSEHIELAG